MENKEIRRENLLWLLRFGNDGRAFEIKELGEKADVPPAYLSQIKNRAKGPDGKERAMGGKVARKIETGLGLPNGWMDAIHGVQEESARPYAVPSPIPKMPELPRYSWGEAAREDKGEGEERMGVPFQTGPRGFVLAVENDAMGEGYGRGGFVIVDPDLEAESGDVVVALADGATVPILRELVIEGGERKLVARNDSYNPPVRAGQVIGPVVGYWRPGRART